MCARGRDVIYHPDPEGLRQPVVLAPLNLQNGRRGSSTMQPAIAVGFNLLSWPSSSGLTCLLLSMLWKVPSFPGRPYTCLWCLLRPRLHTGIFNELRFNSVMLRWQALGHLDHSLHQVACRTCAQLWLTSCVKVQALTNTDHSFLHSGALSNRCADLILLSCKQGSIL